MHIAGLLAVVREANRRPPELDRACAVVQPDENRLIPVNSVRTKLDAFLRECGSGTLLVRSCDCDNAEAYDSHFDSVWQVDSLASLGRQIEDRQWLNVFLDSQPLNALDDAETVSARVRRLEEFEQRYSEALDLSKRVTRCGFGPDVANQIRRKFQQNVRDLCRHLGAYRESTELAKHEYILSQACSDASSYDDQAQAAVTYAAALYAPHRFDDISQLLEPWRERLTEHPLLVRPITRVMVFNTLGRALVALSRPGWEDLFLKSETLLRIFEPTDLPRTWFYRAQAYLRDGRLSEADDVLQQIERHPCVTEMSRWFFRFLQADAARRKGQIWVDPDMERTKVSRAESGIPSVSTCRRQPGNPAGIRPMHLRGSIALENS